MSRVRIALFGGGVLAIAGLLVGAALLLQQELRSWSAAACAEQARTRADRVADRLRAELESWRDLSAILALDHEEMGLAFARSEAATDSRDRALMWRDAEGERAIFGGGIALECASAMEAGAAALQRSSDGEIFLRAAFRASPSGAWLLWARRIDSGWITPEEQRSVWLKSESVQIEPVRDGGSARELPSVWSVAGIAGIQLGVGVVPAEELAGFGSLLQLILFLGLLLAALAAGALWFGGRAIYAHREASRMDVLTGLFNRRLFHDLLAEEVAKAARYGRSLSLAIVDLDSFKAINDTLGHRAGDRVLQGAAEVLRTAVRRSDMVFRFGGEEFAILMPETDELAAAAALDRVREALERQEIPYGRGKASVNCSIGVTALQEGETTEDLVVRADQACYAAKRRGRNQVVLDRVVDGKLRELSLAELSALSESE